MLTYLTGAPLLATSDMIEIDARPVVKIMDFHRVPRYDYSYIHATLQCVSYVSRACGLNEHQALDMVVLTKLGLMKTLRSDLSYVRCLSTPEIDIVQLAVRSMAGSVRSHNNESGFTEVVHLNEVLSVNEDILYRVADLDPRRQLAVPLFSLREEDKLKDITAWRWFDRVMRSDDVEQYAGEAAVPPILRPVEFTLVPDKVNDLMEVALAMRHALNLCVLLANQSSLIRNSHTLRICLIEHLFVRVIPLPLGLNHPERSTRCFWAAQPMRYESQTDLLKLIHQLSRHFTASAFSVKPTNLGDSTRLLTHACMTAVVDAIFRKVAFDIPCQASMHYSGEAIGPVQPFGFEVGQFVEESEFLIFPTAETAG